MQLSLPPYWYGLDLEQQQQVRETLQFPAYPLPNIAKLK